jgi:hypothetical protein
MSQYNHTELIEHQLEEVSQEDLKSDHVKLMEAYARINHKLDLLIQKRRESRYS